MDAWLQAAAVMSASQVESNGVEEVERANRWRAIAIKEFKRAMRTSSLFVNSGRPGGRAGQESRACEAQKHNGLVAFCIRG